MFFVGPDDGADRDVRRGAVGDVLDMRRLGEDMLFIDHLPLVFLKSTTSRSPDSLEEWGFMEALDT